MASDEVTSVEIPVPDPDGEDPTVETVTRPEDAPWGLKPDGTPYKVNPERYKTRARNAGRKPSAPKAKSSKAKTSPHRDAVLGLLQIVSLPVAMAATRSDVFTADLVAINMCGEPIADAFESLAAQNKPVAAALDRLAEVGPYGLVMAAVAPLVLQIAVNHGVIPPGTAGTVPPEVLLAEIAGEPENGAQGGMAA